MPIFHRFAPNSIKGYVRQYRENHGRCNQCHDESHQPPRNGIIKNQGRKSQALPWWMGSWWTIMAATQPINQVANVSALDARTISIQPWEKYDATHLKGHHSGQYRHQPQNDGNSSAFPSPLTEEEEGTGKKNATAKESMEKYPFNIRRDAIEHIKNFRKTV